MLSYKENIHVVMGQSYLLVRIHDESSSLVNQILGKESSPRLSS